jgi:multidrug efflux pump subunit AcrA (membrane-fusion protein)
MKLQIKQAKILTRALPFFVWFCALIIVVLMFLQKSAAVELKGVVFSHEQIINTTETGYLRSIPVTLYQEVKKGDTLAIVKENTIAREEYIDTLLQAQRETAEAELERLKAELVAAENRLLLTDTERENETMAIERRLAVDLERARLEVLEITATLEPDRLTLKDLEVENEIVQKLVNEQAAEIYELKKKSTGLNTY